MRDECGDKGSEGRERETVLGVMALTGFLSMLVIIAERKGKNFFFVENI